MILKSMLGQLVCAIPLIVNGTRFTYLGVTTLFSWA